MNATTLRTCFREQDIPMVEKEIKCAHDMANAVLDHMNNGQISAALKRDEDLKKSLESLMDLYNLKTDEEMNLRRNYF